MIKKLCILLLSVCTVAPGMAQQYSSSDASFAPKKGQWQVSAVIGNNQMFDQDMEYLLPTYWNGKPNATEGFDVTVGLPGTDFQSGDPGYYLNLGDLNSNTLMNLIGIQGKYFLTDRWDVNAMFSMNINATPSKDYIEGDEILSFSLDKNIAKKFAGENGKVRKQKIKPKDTLGSFQTSGEYELLVRRE